METFNAALSKVAPWMWTTGSGLALFYLYRAWWICHRYERNRSATSVTQEVKQTTAVLAFFAVLMTLLGILNIAAILVYPILQQARYHVPPLFQWLQMFSLLTLLGLPYGLAFVGFRKTRFLLFDSVGRRP